MFGLFKKDKEITEIKRMIIKNRYEMSEKAYVELLKEAEKIAPEKKKEDSFWSSLFSSPGLIPPPPSF